ncbi:MAG: type II restriction endonuclease [Halioglobus sp.]
MAAKNLTAVDADPDSSNQHEFGGLKKAGFGDFLGQPSLETYQFDADFYYFSDDLTEPLAAQSLVSWYDSRREAPHRGPELRLYYQANEVTSQFSAGDLMVIALRPDRRLMLFFAAADSGAANTLRYLFQVSPVQESGFVAERFQAGIELDVVRGTILQALDIAPVEPDPSPDIDDLVTAKFGLVFPTTAVFSSFARETLQGLNAVNDPDGVLLQWMSREEELFFAMERRIVEDKLEAGFSDVDDFVSFSLSVQNRRKSRAGHALEHHLAAVFEPVGLQFDRGKMTEKKAKPDFIFPSINAYHDPGTDQSLLTMLGAKTSCKDRWRQVLTEAVRIPEKHLLTLQPAISADQLAEMRSHKLQLVIPLPLHATYDPEQRKLLMSLGDFITMTSDRQAKLGH